MASTQVKHAEAESDKEKGNAAFKSQDYVLAVKHYTRAIQNDPTDSTYPSNRAMAYLKLNKFMDAERDCTAALKINPDHAKALFRRGTARRELAKLEEAKQDLQAALKLEPTNQSVKSELEKVEKEQKFTEAAKKAKAKAKPIDPSSLRPSPPPPSDVSQPTTSPTSSWDHHKPPKPSSTTTPTSQRTKAKLAAAIQPDPEEDDGLMKPLSTRRLPPPTSGAPLPIVPSDASRAAAPTTRNGKSFGEAKAQRAEKEKSRLERIVASGSQSNASPLQSGEPLASSFQTSDPAPLVPSFVKPRLPPPRTTFEFERRWHEHGVPKSDREDDDIWQERWEILKSVPPRYFPNVFQSGLDPGLLSDFVKVLDRTSRRSGDLDAVIEVLDNLPKVPRFSFLAMLLDESECTAIRGILDQAKKSGKSQGAVDGIKTAWGL